MASQPSVEMVVSVVPSLSSSSGSDARLLQLLRFKETSPGSNCIAAGTLRNVSLFPTSRQVKDGNRLQQNSITASFTAKRCSFRVWMRVRSMGKLLRTASAELALNEELA